MSARSFLWEKKEGTKSLILQGDYDALSDFYREKVFSQFPLLSGICFDVIDAMNATQVDGVKRLVSLYLKSLFLEGVGKRALQVRSKGRK